MEHYGDITKISGYDVPCVDIITGGSPCQDLSVAGKREGLAGERSGLFMEQIRIIKEMRDGFSKELRGRGSDEYIRPRYMVWENVPGAFSSNKGEDFRVVLEETARVADKTAVIPRPPKGKWSNSGAVMGDGWSIAWRVHDAQFWGVPQRRKRIALVADFGGSTAPEILFERKGVFGDITESGKEGKGIAENAERSIGETGKCLNSWDVQSKHIQPENGIAEALYSGECRGGGGEQYVMQDKPMVFDASRRHNYEPFDEVSETVQAHYGTGGGNTPIVLEGNGSRPSRMGNGYVESGTMYTLNSTERHAVISFGNGQLHDAMSPSVEIAKTLNCLVDPAKIVTYANEALFERQGRASACAYDGTQISPTLTANNAGGQQRMPDKDNFNAVITYGLDRASYNQGQNAKFGFCIDEEKVGAQTAKGPGAVCSPGAIVRRLTPLECERLQGYPDGWTNIGEWVDSKGKKHKDADSPRYKALGNSIALPFWEWMAKRMRPYLGSNPTMASLFDGIGGFPLVYSRCGVKPMWASEIEEFPIAVTKARIQ